MQLVPLHAGVQWSGCGVVFVMLGWEVVEKYLKSAKRISPKRA